MPLLKQPDPQMQILTSAISILKSQALKKTLGQMKFRACYSLISLKQQQQSKQTSRKPIDFVTEAAFYGAALMDAFQAYSFISSKSGIISLQQKTDSAAVTSRCDRTVSLSQCRPGPVRPSISCESTSHSPPVFSQERPAYK